VHAAGARAQSIDASFRLESRLKVIWDEGLAALAAAEAPLAE
jgi:hypothetical protein